MCGRLPRPGRDCSHRAWGPESALVIRWMSPVRRSAIGIATRRSTITGTVMMASVGTIIRELNPATTSRDG